MPVLARPRVTDSPARMMTTTLQMLVKIIVIAALIVGAHAAQPTTMTSELTHESNSELVTATRAISASSSPWGQFFAGFSWPTLFGGQQRVEADAETADGESEGFVSRTFGLNRLKKKITIGLLPVMFKLGIMVMVIFTILLMSIKSVFIGTALLIINLGFILAKIIAWKKSAGHSEHHHGGYLEHSGWAPQYGGGGGGKQNNDIHVHIHNPAPAPSHDLPYSGYAPQQSNRGPSIHIEPAPYSSGGSNEGWPGYQRRQSPYGGDYLDSSAVNYQAQAKPQYVTTNQNQWS